MWERTEYDCNGFCKRFFLLSSNFKPTMHSSSWLCFKINKKKIVSMYLRLPRTSVLCWNNRRILFYTNSHCVSSLNLIKALFTHIYTTWVQSFHYLLPNKIFCSSLCYHTWKYMDATKYLPLPNSIANERSLYCSLKNILCSHNAHVNVILVIPLDVLLLIWLIGNHFILHYSVFYIYGTRTSTMFVKNSVKCVKFNCLSTFSEAGFHHFFLKFTNNKERKEVWKIFHRRLPLSRLLAKILRGNKAAMKKFLKNLLFVADVKTVGPVTHV